MLNPPFKIRYIYYWKDINNYTKLIIILTLSLYISFRGCFSLRKYTYRYPNGIRIPFLSEGSVELLAEVIRENIQEKTVIICIGTDRCIGDALGPMVGTFLQNNSFRLPLYGTLEAPIHAVNLEQSISNIKTIHPNAFIIAIDACIGAEDNIGNIHIKNGPVYPGKGVGKKLPGVGDISIVGIVDKINQEDCYAIHNVRLSLVMKMARVISDAIELAALLS
ncbi:MAG: spore protease YyaC [Alkaliphilus sp.]|nr:spore protease YyaC [Alkaliphilus sp.]